MQLRSIERRALQLRPYKGRALQLCFLEQRPLQLCFLERRPLQLCFLEVRALQLRTIERRASGAGRPCVDWTVFGMADPSRNCVRVCISASPLYGTSGVCDTAFRVRRPS